MLVRALLADSSLSKLTNPNPLDFPVSLSVITLAASTIPVTNSVLLVVNNKTMFYQEFFFKQRGKKLIIVLS